MIFGVAWYFAKPKSAFVKQALERVPSGFRREFEIADIDAEPRANAGSDWHYHHIIGGECRHTKAADQVSRAVHTAKALIYRGNIRHIVHIYGDLQVNKKVSSASSKRAKSDIRGLDWGR